MKGSINESVADINAWIKEQVIIIDDDDGHLDDNVDNDDDGEMPLADYLSKFKTKFCLGEIVYATVDGYPPWPAIVDLDPDMNMYFWMENRDTEITHYHVTFLDNCKNKERYWCEVGKMKRFDKNLSLNKKRITKCKTKYQEGVKKATELARIRNCDDRLKLCGFKKPKKVTSKKKIKGTTNVVKHMATGRVPGTNVVTHYIQGDVVWAQVPGHPFWPGIVDNDPELKTYLQTKNSKKADQMEYHIVFLDYNRVSRSWCDSKYMKNFGREQIVITRQHFNAYKDRFIKGIRDALVALQLNRQERVKEFGLENSLSELGIRVTS